MDEALDTFLRKDTTVTRQVAAHISIFLSNEEKDDDDWALRELCSHILYANPLHISSAQHSIFYNLIRQHSTGFEAPLPPQYSIIVNGGAKIIEISYLAGLAVVLRTLVDPKIHTRLQSVNDIPRSLVLPFLKRTGFRRYLMERIFASVEDSLDAMQLYKDAVIGAATMEHLITMQNTAVNAGNYETPVNEPCQYDRDHLEKHNDNMELDGAGPDQRSMEEAHSDVMQGTTPSGPIVLLPLRKFMQSRRVGICSMSQLHLLCTAYSYLRGELESTLKTIEAMPPPSPRVRAMCSVEFLFSALHTHITESIDNQSSNSVAMRELYSDPHMSVLLSKIDEIGQHLLGVMRGQSPSLMLSMHYETQSAFSDSFYQEMESHFPELCYTATTHPERPVGRRWVPVSCTAMPISLLVAILTANGSLLTPMLQLKSFLHGKHRTEYLAYELPQATTRVSLEVAFISIRRRYAEFFPRLFEHRHVTLVSQQVVYLVAKPDYIEPVKLLMLLEALADRGAMQTYNFYTNVFLKALVVAKPDSVLSEIALYCIVNAFALLIGGKRARTQLLQPGEEGYTIYQYLPQVLGMLPNMEEEAQRKAVLGFLCIKRRTQSASAQAMQILLGRDVEAFPENSQLQTELNAMSKKMIDDGVSTFSARVLNGRRKAPIWLGIYEAILSGKHTLSSSECFLILCGLGCEKPPKIFRKPERRTMDGTYKIGPAQMLLNAQDLRDGNHERLKSIVQNSPLFEDSTGLLNPQRLAKDSNKQFSRTEFAFPRVFHKLPECHTSLANALLKVEQMAFCYPGHYVEIPRFSVLAEQHVEEHQFEYQLSLDDHLEVYFEACLFLCDNPAKWTQAPLPKSDLLLSSPIQTVIDCGQLLELALLYNEDWSQGDVTRGTPYAGGRYTKLIQDVQERIN